MNTRTVHTCPRPRARRLAHLLPARRPAHRFGLLVARPRRGPGARRDGHGNEWDRILIPGNYAHLYFREKLWTDEEWTRLLARDRTSMIP